MIPLVEDKLPGSVAFNSYDMLSVRRVHNIDENTPRQARMRDRVDLTRYAIRRGPIEA